MYFSEFQGSGLTWTIFQETLHFRLLQNRTNLISAAKI